MSCRYYLFPINNIYASVLYACYLFSRQIITEKIDTIYFQYKIQGSPTLIHSKVDVKIIGYGYNNKSILMK